MLTPMRLCNIDRNAIYIFTSTFSRNPQIVRAHTHTHTHTHPQHSSTTTENEMNYDLIYLILMRLMSGYIWRIFRGWSSSFLMYVISRSRNRLNSFRCLVVLINVLIYYDCRCRYVSLMLLLLRLMLLLLLLLNAHAATHCCHFHKYWDYWEMIIFVSWIV